MGGDCRCAAVENCQAKDTIEKKMPLPLEDFGMSAPDDGEGQRRRKPRPYVIEVTTRASKICERFSSYEAAQARIAEIPAESIVGIPLIFKELPDGSCRAV